MSFSPARRVWLVPLPIRPHPRAGEAPERRDASFRYASFHSEREERRAGCGGGAFALDVRRTRARVRRPFRRIRLRLVGPRAGSSWTTWFPPRWGGPCAQALADDSRRDRTHAVFSFGEATCAAGLNPREGIKPP